MNPYVLTALAMCMVLGVATIGTSYLAVYFTKKAKADLEALLTPLSNAIDGEVDLDEAEVKGSYRGSLVMARMAAAAAGTVRLWQVDVIDSAGGAGWNYVYSRPRTRKGETEPTIDIVTESDPIRARLNRISVETIAPTQPNATDWVQIEYSPEAGHVRLARPMHGRNDIPDVDAFQRDLDFLIQVGDENRTMQDSMRSERGAGDDHN